MIEAIYHLFADQPIDLEKKAKLIALGQTVDTWTPTSRSGLAKLQKYRAEVLSKRPLSGEEAQDALFAYEIRVGFPSGNTEGDIPSLLTMIFGKISLDGQIRLMDIRFPKRYLKDKGPKFGIQGIRERVKEPNHPLVMAIFKPCVGLTPKELGQMFLELARGGLHLVKDDEILPDLSGCPTERRLEACLKSGEKAYRETKRHTLYAVNLTAPPSQLIAKAKRLKKLGAECFLFNVLSYGYGALEELREVGVPIMAHPALAGALSASPKTGMSYKVVLGELMRLGGADLVLFPSSYGTVALPRPVTESIRHALTHTTPIRPSFPTPSAGIHPGLVPQILRDFGRDVVINAGGGVHGHPKGAAAGVRAFRQAVAWALDHTSYDTLPAGQHPELDEALALWGKK